VVQGKGQKDRYVPIPDVLLHEWRQYWQVYQPNRWLFPSRHHQPMCISTLQTCYRRSKQAAGICKHGGIHSLRHAFATHALQAGMPIHQLQRILGHRHLSTTSRYTHWLVDNQDGHSAIDLISGLHGTRSCSG
ncbi:MAG: tyrosine-type recombinase/integrase, partial [Thiothrix litoralis]